jgi:hypothetical protein
MTDPTLIESHYQEMLDGLVSMFSDAENLQKLLDIVAQQIQDTEQTIFDLWFECLLSNSNGAQLDQYGRIVGQPRMGLSDADYRKTINVRIQVNRGKGEVTRLISAMTRLLGNTVHYQWVAPAFYSMSFISAVPISGQWELFIQGIVLDLTPAGVGYELIEAPTGAFQFDSGPGFDVGKYARFVSTA